MRLECFRSGGPPTVDLAFESEMLELAAGGTPVALTTSWTGPVVVLGYAQPPTDVDLDWCRRRGVPVLRRMTGGTGVIHHGDLGMSLALPAEHPWASAIVGLYDRFLDVLEPALAALGSRAVRLGEPARAGRDRSPICFEDQLADTLAVDGRKAVGCSQTRRRGAVLIHAAILLGLDAGLYTHVFGVDEDRVLEGLAPAIEGIEPDRVADALIAGLSSRIGFDIEDRGGPKPGSEHLALYRQERWSPVPDGGMQ